MIDGRRTSLCAAVAAIVAVTLAAPRLLAMFVAVETENVPIDRVLENLERLAVCRSLRRQHAAESCARAFDGLGNQVGHDARHQAPRRPRARGGEIRTGVRVQGFRAFKSSRREIPRSCGSHSNI